MNPGVVALTHSLSKYQKEKGFKVLYAGIINTKRPREEY